MKMPAQRSPKFRDLKRLTGRRKVELVGTLELLWLFTMEHAPSGDIGKWPDADIELECDWDGEPGFLITALVESGWLDRCLTHRLLVHDWSDHLPEFLRLKVSRGGLKIVELNPPLPTSIVPAGENVRRQYDDSTTLVEREGKGSQGKRSMKDPSDLALAEVPEVTEGAEPWRPLLNVISKLDGEVDEKSAWLAENYDSIAIAVEEGKRGFKGETMAWYKQYLKSARDGTRKREYKNWDAKQAHKARQASEPIYEATEAAIPEGAMLELSSTEDPF